MINARWAFAVIFLGSASILALTKLVPTIQEYVSQEVPIAKISMKRVDGGHFGHPELEFEIPRSAVYDDNAQAYVYEYYPDSDAIPRFKMIVFVTEKDARHFKDSIDALNSDSTFATQAEVNNWGRKGTLVDINSYYNPSEQFRTIYYQPQGVRYSIQFGTGSAFNAGARILANRIIKTVSIRER